MLAFAIKADKPGRKDRFRVAHDIGRGHVGNNPAMCAMIFPAHGGRLRILFFWIEAYSKAMSFCVGILAQPSKITMSKHARDTRLDASRDGWRGLTPDGAAIVEAEHLESWAETGTTTSQTG